MVVLLVFTVLSRLGYLNFVGVSVVFSESMEPALRPGDLVVYLNVNFSVGDIMVYCLTPSHCVVHRVVGFMVLDTISGDKVMVVTKGDNVEVTDNPVSLENVRGKVVFSLVREVWLPLVILLLAYSLYGVVRTPVIGYSYAVLLAVGLVSMAAVYTVTPDIIVRDMVKPPVVSLAGVYFDSENCALKIRYTGEVMLTDVNVRVNSTDAEIIVIDGREVILRPGINLFREAFEYRRPLLIDVRASLSSVGRLTGEYTTLIGGYNPELSNANGVLFISNPNCFPLHVNVSLKYFSNGEWLWSNWTYVVEGFSHLVVEPPEDARLAYTYVYWLNQGDRRWVGLPLKME